MTSSVSTECCNQSTTYRKVCEQLGHNTGMSSNGTNIMMKRMSFNNPTECQKADVENIAIDEHHAILFLIGADK